MPIQRAIYELKRKRLALNGSAEKLN